MAERNPSGDTARQPAIAGGGQVMQAAQRQGVTRAATLKRGSSYDMYVGTRAQLIATGHVRDGMFPGDHGCALVKTMFREDGSAMPRYGTREARREARLTISRRSNVTFEVVIYVTEDERQRRDDQERRVRIELELLGSWGYPDPDNAACAAAAALIARARARRGSV